MMSVDLFVYFFTFFIRAGENGHKCEIINQNFEIMNHRFQIMLGSRGLQGCV